MLVAVSLATLALSFHSWHAVHLSKHLHPLPLYGYTCWRLCSAKSRQLWLNSQ